MPLFEPHANPLSGAGGYWLFSAGKKNYQKEKGSITKEKRFGLKTKNKKMQIPLFFA